MRFGSLFSGIGGLDLGLERAGMQCAWQIENDPYCVRVLEKHWPDLTRKGDIRECDGRDLEAVDLVAGGFPCQDLSLAGKGAGLSGERSGLFFELVRLVRILRPNYVLQENVTGLLGRGMGRVLGELSALGYDAEWECVPAAAFGAPHLRWRVFIVAYAERNRRGKPTRTVEREGESLRPAQWEESSSVVGSGSADVVVAGEGGCGAGKQDVPAREPDAARSGPHVADTDRTGREEQRRSVSVFAEHSAPEFSSWWEAEPALDRVVDGFPGRVDQLRGLGNAVIPQVGEWIGHLILDHERRCAA